MKRILFVSLFVASTLAAQSTPKVHALPASPSTVAFGYYWAGAKPALHIASGDMVDVETLLTNSPTGLANANVPADQIQQSLRDVYAQVTGADRGPGGHILTGPIFVDGADSGDVIEVKFISIDIAIPYGYNGCSGFMRELCMRVPTKIIQLDRQKMTGAMDSGIVIPLHPFFGSVGVAPAASLGRVNSNPPGPHAGNIDNKMLVAGTSLFIPVFVPGALLEIGDGHAAQGDGEVDQTAIETSLKSRIQVIVHKKMPMDWPRIETPTSWMTMGTDTSLTVATKTAIREMTKLIMEKKGLSQGEAYRLASIAADLHIAELVDQNVGVYMIISKSILGVK